MLIKTSKCDVALDEILNTNRFDFYKAAQSPGWLKIMRGEESSETDEYGVTSISFDARRPFHPERFHRFLHTEFPGLYRAKGFFWIASQPDFLAEMAIAGTVREFNPKGFWWATMPEEEWPEAEREYIKKDWHEYFGDRFQKLVFIGKSEILNDIQTALKHCLITDEELSQNASNIRDLEDPFGNWEELYKTAAEGQESSFE